MKKKVEETIVVEKSFCNICGEEVKREPFNKERIAIVRGLFKNGNFDAHEICINKITRLAFKKYVQ